MVTYQEFQRQYMAYRKQAEAIAQALAPATPRYHDWMLEGLYFDKDDVYVVLTYHLAGKVEYFEAYFKADVLGIDLADAIAIVRGRQAM